MKKYLVAMLLLVSVMAYGQKPLSYSSVIETPGVSAEKAFQRVELFMVNSFDRHEKVMQMNDKENLKMVMKVTAKFKSKKGNAGNINGYIDYVINLFFREGRFKLIMKSIEHRGKDGKCNFGIIDDKEVPDISIAFASKKWKANIYQEMKNCAHVDFIYLQENLKQVANTTTAEDDDNW